MFFVLKAGFHKLMNSSIAESDYSNAAGTSLLKFLSVVDIFFKCVRTLKDFS